MTGRESTQIEAEARQEVAGHRWLLPLALLVGLLLRLGTWSQVFVGGRAWVDGPDGYYHLRRIWLTLQNWPWAPQTDMMIGVPEGGPVSWPPVFDLLIATLALPWRGASEELLEVIGVLTPPVLGLLEIFVLYALVHRLFGRLAAGWTALFAAILPGVSRYSLLGALDHDPLVETLAMVALFGLAGALTGGERWRNAAWVAVGLTLLVLTWAGSIIHLGLLCCLTLALDWPSVRARENPAAAFALGFGGLGAAVATLPYIARSVWTERLGATFIGLSWLHTAAILGAAAVGLGLTVWVHRRPAYAAALGLCVLGLALLLGAAGPAFVDGLTFFGRGEPFLQGVMESRPLLSLFGELDLRAPVIRLSLLPLLIPVLLPLTLLRSGVDRRMLLLWTWLVYMLSMALVQSRFSHAAALPVAALAGTLAARLSTLESAVLRRSLVGGLALLVIVPSLPAYLSTPGLEPFRFFGRSPRILSTGFVEASDFLRQVAEPSPSWSNHRTPSTSSVLAPWSAGHWVIWEARQGAVTTPLGPQGQPAFADGIRFYLTPDERQALDLLEKHRVHFVVTMARIPPLGAYVKLVNADPSAVFAVDSAPGPWPLDAEKYLATVAARLTWSGNRGISLFGRELPALSRFTEVFRSRGSRPNPFAQAIPGSEPEVPLIRVYEVERLAPEAELDPPGVADRHASEQ